MQTSLLWSDTEIKRRWNWLDCLKIGGPPQESTFCPESSLFSSGELNLSPHYIGLILLYTCEELPLIMGRADRKPSRLLSASAIQEKKIQLLVVRYKYGIFLIIMVINYLYNKNILLKNNKCITWWTDVIQ